MNGREWCVAVPGLAVLLVAGVSGLEKPDIPAARKHYIFMDTNADRSVNQEEFQNAQELAEAILDIDFETADENDDGTLTFEEYRAYSNYVQETAQEEGETDQAEMLADVLESSVSSEEDNAELDKLMADLQQADQPDVVSYVMARPTVYPFAYQTLVRWARVYPRQRVWVRKVYAHRRAHPGPAVPARPRPARTVAPRPRRARPVAPRPRRARP